MEDSREVKEIFIKANAGDSEAQFRVGNLYYEGRDIEQDWGKAFNFFKMSAEQGNSKAMYALALSYLDGEGVIQDQEIGFFWMRRAAEEGLSIAQYKVSNFYWAGVGVESNKQKSEYWLLKAAESNVLDAQSLLGASYCNGDYGITDFEKGKYWLEKAAENGDFEAMINLSRMYEYGDGVEQNAETAFLWVEKAAECDEQDAWTLLGEKYYSGEGVEKDIQKAKYWFEKAAEREQPSALCNMGIIYWNGEGVEKDWVCSNQYMKKAAELGNQTAMYNYALNLLSGEGVEQDKEKGLLLMEKVAKLGVPAACHEMHIHLNKSNPQEAREWLKKAARGGIKSDLIWLIELLEQERYEAEEAGTAASFNYDELKYWLELGVNEECPLAYIHYGNELLQGKIVEQEIAKGLRYIEFAENSDDVEAVSQMVEIYEHGILPYIVRDIKRAIELCKRAISMIESGSGNEYDRSEGFYYNQKYKLGWLYMNPQYGVNDVAQGIPVLEEAAQHNNVPAMRLLALCYSDGVNLPPNKEKATKYLGVYMECDKEYDTQFCEEIQKMLKDVKPHKKPIFGFLKR